MRMGDKKVVDSMMYDGLFCAFDQVRHGRRHREVRRVGRHRPRRRRTSSPPSRTSVPPGPSKDGLFDDEIVTVEVPQRKGDPIVVQRPTRASAPSTTAESLGQLRPAFDKAGNITAGNASQISDGGAAVIVASKAAAEQLGVDPLGEIVGNGQVAGPDPSLLTQPSRAIFAGPRAGRASRVATSTCSSSTRRSPPSASRRWRTSASPTRSSTSTAAPSPSATRSACPAPASCSRSSTSCTRRGGGLGAAALCGGGGQGDALLVKTV